MNFNILDKSLYKILTYNKGDIIFNENDTCNFLGICLEGRISVRTFSYDDSSFEITLLKENDIFGSALVFDSFPFLGTAISLTKTKVLLIHKNNLLSCFKNEDFLLYYFKAQAKKHLLTQQKLKVLSQGTIRNKILYLLYKNNINNSYTFKSIDSLANYLCITRPSLSRELHKMEKEGIITLNKHTIIYNKTCKTK